MSVVLKLWPCFISLVLCFVSINKLEAKESYWQLSNNLSLSNESNYGLDVENENSVSKVSNRIRMKVGLSNSKTDFMSYFEEKVSYFLNESELDTLANPKASIGLTHRTSEINTFNLQADFRKDDSNSTEYFEQNGFYQVLARNKEKDRQTQTLTTSWTSLFKPRLQSKLSFNASNVEYEDAENTGLINYQNMGAEASLYFLYTEQFDIYALLSASNFTTDPTNEFIQQINAVDSKNVNASIGFRYRLDDVQEIGGSFGKRWSNYDRQFDSSRSSQSGWVTSVEYKHAFESIQFLMSAVRAVEPSSAGSIVLNDRVNIGLTQQISEKSAFKFNVIQSREQQEITKQVLQENYAEINAEYSFELNPVNNLFLSLRYRREGDEVYADSYGIRFGWNWSTPKHFY